MSMQNCLIFQNHGRHWSIRNKSNPFLIIATRKIEREVYRRINIGNARRSCVLNDAERQVWHCIPKIQNLERR